MFSDLREYLKRVEELGRCKLIEGADWDLEIGTITELQSRPDTALLVFDKIKDYPAGYRVVTNPAASLRQVALILGLPEYFKAMELVKAVRDKMRSGFDPIPPVQVDTGPVSEHVHTGEDIDLFEFPTPRWHELDGGRYIGTGDMVIMRDPDEGWVNLGTHRVQVHDKNTATIYMSPFQHDAIIARKYWAKGQSCPVAVSCGQEPTVWLISTVRIPWGISEYDYAGWLRNGPVEVIKSEITGLPIPATAEIVLEGELVPPEVETRMEGPFGEYTGYYGGRSAPAPAFRIKRILHRNNPVLLGAPPFRLLPLYWYGGHLIRAAQIWNEMDRNVPGVRGVWVLEDAAIRVPIVSIKQEYAGHANDAALAAKLLNLIGKFSIVVDDDIDPSNISEVIWAVATRCDPESSIDIIRGSRSSRLDPRLPPEKRAQNDLTGSVAIINACKPFDWISEFPTTVRSSPELLSKTREKWGRFLD